LISIKNTNLLIGAKLSGHTIVSLRTAAEHH